MFRDFVKTLSYSMMRQIYLIVVMLLFQNYLTRAQVNFLLNGSFEDVNTCTEYQAECGVEGWFYLKDVKAQMLGNDSSIERLGKNSFGVRYNWVGYTGFSPVIGTILPCGLQVNHRYTFKGMIKATLNSHLILKPGICLGEKFYVPGRAFSKNIQPAPILFIAPVSRSDFFAFQYSFIADGKERYLTFGTYIEEDTTSARKKLIGVQTVSIVLDNFELTPENKKEIYCSGFLFNRENIYNYNFRHKEMDYSLFGKGELPIPLNNTGPGYFTRFKEPERQPLHSDTLKLGDVLFDFNKAKLKQEAVVMLETFFINTGNPNPVDRLYIDGHTDSIGSDKKNIELSNRRCETIRDWLIQHTGIPENRIYIRPYGEARPIAPNGTPEGRALNRRVEMIVFRKTEN
jgi:outer membrane protein OmpA-like peptidoglycan-associated protein